MPDVGTTSTHDATQSRKPKLHIIYCDTDMKIGHIVGRIVFCNLQGVRYLVFIYISSFFSVSTQQRQELTNIHCVIFFLIGILAVGVKLGPLNIAAT
jgi:hypothetical protein